MHANIDQPFGGSDRLLSLIEMIYKAVDDALLWPAVLEKISEAVRGRESLLFTSFADPTTPNVSCLARMDPVDLQPYSAYYSSVNVLASRCDAMFVDGTPRYSHQAVNDSEFETTEFCNDYFHPRDMHYSMGLKIPIAGTAPAYLTLMRPKRIGYFDEREGRVLEVLKPHLQQALKLHLQFSQMRLNAKGLEQGLDAFAHAVFGIGHDGCVVLSNSTAEKIASKGEALRLVNGRLRAAHPAEDSLFQKYLQDAVATGERRGSSSGGVVKLSGRSGEEPLAVIIVPTQSTVLDSYGQLGALVFVRDSSSTVSRSSAMRSLYQLTPSEARVADLLAAGHEVAEIANMAHISLETARFQIKRVMAKTGTRRQAELIRLILSLPSQGNISS